MACSRATAEDAPVLLSSERGHARDRLAATEVRDLILDHADVPRAAVR